MAMTSFYETNWPDKLRNRGPIMRCRFLMFQHILRIPGNSCIYSICRKFTFNDQKITLVVDTSEYIVLEK